MCFIKTFLALELQNRISITLEKLRNAKLSGFPVLRMPQVSQILLISPSEAIYKVAASPGARVNCKLFSLMISYNWVSSSEQQLCGGRQQHLSSARSNSSKSTSTIYVLVPDTSGRKNSTSGLPDGDFEFVGGRIRWRFHSLAAP